MTTRENKAVDIDFSEEILEAFFALDKAATNEDLEDLFYFVVDSFQFAGVQIALDEIDVDQAVVDVRTVLDEYLQAKAPPPPNQHLFLILDKELHSFPWESLPSLAGQSVSRLPSLSFLRDRLELYKRSPTFLNAISIDSKKVFYTLNPGSDLVSTQKEFSEWLTATGWTGIIGRKPMEEEIRKALSRHDLFLCVALLTKPDKQKLTGRHRYFGHGGAEQYIRSLTIRGLPRCATAMLWGCSSGRLTEQGDFEETGIPWTYMVAGA